VSEKSLEEQIKTKAQEARKLARYMSSTMDLVENQIQKAQERGEFDNLKGSGKPLSLYENPYEPPEMRMMNKILKDNNFAPYWIELGKEIDSDLENLHREVSYFQRYISMFTQEKLTPVTSQRLEKKKEHFYYETRLVLEKINKKIDNYNLHCPVVRLTRGRIIVNDEMHKIITRIEQSISNIQK